MLFGILFCSDKISRLSVTGGNVVLQTEIEKPCCDCSTYNFCCFCRINTSRECCINKKICIRGACCYCYCPCKKADWINGFKQIICCPCSFVKCLCKYFCIVCCCRKPDVFGNKPIENKQDVDEDAMHDQNFDSIFKVDGLRWVLAIFQQNKNKKEENDTKYQKILKTLRQKPKKQVEGRISLQLTSEEKCVMILMSYLICSEITKADKVPQSLYNIHSKQSLYFLLFTSEIYFSQAHSLLLSAIKQRIGRLSSNRLSIKAEKTLFERSEFVTGVFTNVCRIPFVAERFNTQQVALQLMTNFYTQLADKAASGLIFSCALGEKESENFDRFLSIIPVNKEYKKINQWIVKICFLITLLPKDDDSMKKEESEIREKAFTVQKLFMRLIDYKKIPEIVAFFCVLDCMPREKKDIYSVFPHDVFNDFDKTDLPAIREKYKAFASLLKKNSDDSDNEPEQSINQQPSGYSVAQEKQNELPIVINLKFQDLIHQPTMNDQQQSQNIAQKQNTQDQQQPKNIAQKQNIQDQQQSQNIAQKQNIQDQQQSQNIAQKQNTQDQQQPQNFLISETDENTNCIKPQSIEQQTNFLNYNQDNQQFKEHESYSPKERKSYLPPNINNNFCASYLTTQFQQQVFNVPFSQKHNNQNPLILRQDIGFQDRFNLQEYNQVLPQNNQNLRQDIGFQYRVNSQEYNQVLPQSYQNPNNKKPKQAALGTFLEENGQEGQKRNINGGITVGRYPPSDED